MIALLKAIFTPDYARYEGVRPINIYLLRLVYFLMLAFVATDAWTRILTHPGPWDPVKAVAWCVWASYPTLSFFGLIHPLKMLPLMIFAIMYKVIWLIVVAYPLWRAHTLAGSPAEGLASTFLWVPLPIIAVPWKYVFHTYVMWSRKTAAV
jgi:hypothetical protein